MNKILIISVSDPDPDGSGYFILNTPDPGKSQMNVARIRNTANYPLILVCAPKSD